MDSYHSQIISIAKNSIMHKSKDDSDWVPDLESEEFRSFRELQGAFTTIYRLDDKKLRGCIGVPYPQYPLGESIAISARNSASVDPRFPRISESELDEIFIEVEILSPIEKVEFETIEELINQIRVGTHGLIVRYGNNAGLLLPKVGSRYNWTSLELIENTCRKAMLPIDAYTWDNIEFLIFTSELYSELDLVSSSQEDS